MDAKVKEQILIIRGTGLANMLSVPEVQRLAFERGFYELVIFIEDHRDEYVHFIFYGNDEGEKA